MSDDLISRRALYDKAATLEAQALDYVGKLIERDGEETSVEWRIWSAILTERTAFKHDVYDAPSAQPERCEDCGNFNKARLLITQPERKKGKWIKMSDADGIYWVCSECGEDLPRVPHYNPQFDLFPRLKSIKKTKFCPNCGARLEVEE